MAVSTPPPPPSDPLSTTTTSAATTTVRSNFPPNPRPPHPSHQISHPISHFFSTTTTANHHPPRLPSNPNPNYPRLVPSTHPPLDSTTTTSSTVSSTAAAAAILYPVVSSSHGFIARHVALSNPSSNSIIYPARSVVMASSYPRPSFGYSHPDQGLSPGTVYVSGVCNSIQQAGGVGNSAVKGTAVSVPFSQTQHKIALSSPPVSNFNGHKDLRERSKDDAFVTVQDRKVRASDNASLYALCRSWLRNGSPEESQLQNQDAVRSLPRPLPLSAQDSTSPTIMEGSEEVEEDERSVENLSQKEMLQRHVKRAKRVRSRIREQRLRRIAPYKTRLSLLLPPMVDSNFRNDTVIGMEPK